MLVPMIETNGKTSTLPRPSTVADREQIVVRDLIFLPYIPCPFNVQRPSSGKYVREAVHVNSVEGLNSRVRRTIAGVFHHISPQHADLYFHEIGFRWSQRVVSGSAVRKTRHGREIMRTLWSRVPPAVQLPNVFRAATGRQMRRSPDGDITIKSAVAVFG